MNQCDTPVLHRHIYALVRDAILRSDVADNSVHCEDRHTSYLCARILSVPFYGIGLLADKPERSTIRGSLFVDLKASQVRDHH